MSNIGILISARSASRRLPNKALIKICNKESVSLLIERVKQCRSSNQVILCTTVRPDDDKLACIGLREGVGVFRGEDENVARRLLDAARECNLDHFVRVTGDDLLKCSGLIDTAVASHLANGADYTYMKNVFYGGESEIVSVQALRIIVERAEEPQNTEYLSWYLDNNSVFRTNFIEAGSEYFRPYRLSLDTPEDLAVMVEIYHEFYRDGKPVDVLAALKWLDGHPEITSLNSQITPKLRREQINCKLRP